MSLSPRSSLSTRFVPAALAAGFLCSTASAQYPFELYDWYYKGNGLAQPIEIDTAIYPPALSHGDVVHIELGELADSTAQTELDTALLLQDGRVFINPSTASQDGFDRVGASHTWVSMGLLTEEAQDQLVLSDGTGLYRLFWTDSGSNFVATVTHLMDGTNELGGEQIHASHPSPDDDESYLVVLDGGGSVLKIVSVDGATATLESQFLPTIAQGAFHDACLVNITSDDQRAEQVAVITDRGLEILELSGAPAVIAGVPTYFAGSSTGAFLSVLPAELAAADRDYLLWHVDVPGIGEVVYTIHDAHASINHATGMGLKQMVVANFLDRDGPTLGNLVMARADGTNWVNLLKNEGPTSSSQAVFSLDLSSTEPALIDMNRLPNLEDGSNPPPTAPLVAAGDLNFDGHDDLVMVDAYNRLCVFLGGEISTVSSGAPAYYANRVSAYLSADVPAEKIGIEINFNQSGADSADYFLWYRPVTEAGEPTTVFGEFPVYANTVTSSLNPPLNLPVADVEGIFVLSVYPYAADGTPLAPAGEHFSASVEGEDEVRALDDQRFCWIQYCVDHKPYECGGTGTVPLPHPRTSPVKCNPCRRGQTCQDPTQYGGRDD